MPAYFEVTLWLLSLILEGDRTLVGRSPLIAKRLRDLTDTDLKKYAFKALTTWGNADDFRHFLPRLFELEAVHPQRIVGLVDPEILFGKLAYAQ